MPPPFQRRPGLGARILVQANFSRVASAICEELSSWISENRPRTARLLRAMLVYQEDHCANQLPRILPAFQRVNPVVPRRVEDEGGRGGEGDEAGGGEEERTRNGGRMARRQDGGEGEGTLKGRETGTDAGGRVPTAPGRREGQFDGNKRAGDDPSRPG